MSRTEDSTALRSSEPVIQNNVNAQNYGEYVADFYNAEKSHDSSSELLSPGLSGNSTSDANSSVEVDEPDKQETKASESGDVESNDTDFDDESFKTPPGHGHKSATVEQADEEEEDRHDLEYISRQLSILNEESGELTTPIHKSNRKKLQELAKKSREMAAKRSQSQYKSPAKRFVKLQGRGVKRSPGKPNMLQTPKRKKLALGDKKLAMDDHQVSDNGSDDSEDSSDDKWQILEDSEAEIDKVLEENAEKNKLTALNVKNILHQVITNEHVVAMVRNTLMNESGLGSSQQEAAFEPKMTRSKFKQALEETGDLIHPWPLTPLKQPKSKGKSFLDMELTDEEEDSDVDYNPEKDKESFSDEDSESVASSRLSDIGSPSSATPATPRTPSSQISDADISQTTENAKSQSFCSPMGPPSKPLSRKQALGRKYQEAMAANDKKEESETIALRTRSKLSLEDTSMTELESSFMPPDFNPEMYETECDDADWQLFLASIWNPPENENTNDGIDDEENDPEYNYLAEAEAESKDIEKDVKDEFRSDRAVKISKREMNNLMDELFDYYHDAEELEEQEKREMKMKARTQIKKIKTDIAATTSASHIMTEHEREQLADQMRKHVQLLTQMYVLAQSNQKDYTIIAENSKCLLKEVHKFKEINMEHMTPNTAYNACNLEAAISLVDKDEDWQQLDPGKRYSSGVHVSPEKSIANMLLKNYNTLSRRKKDLILDMVGNSDDKPTERPNMPSRFHLPPLTKQQKGIFFGSEVFIYPEYLPVGGFLFKKDLNQGPKSRVTFTEAEDNLIALGLEQFKKLPYYTKLIQKFLLPCKTHKQIKIRIKNLGCAKAPPNTVKYLKQMGKLPEFPKYTKSFNLDMMIPPSKQNVKNLPIWCKELKIQEIMRAPESPPEKTESMQRSQSVNLPIICAESIQKNDERSNSAPATPMTQSSSVTKMSQPRTAALTPDKHASVVDSVQLDSQEVTLCHSSQEEDHDVTEKESCRTPGSVVSLSQCSVSNTQSFVEHNIQTLKCSSPGFIALHDNISTSSCQGSPIKIRIVDNEAVSRSKEITKEAIKEKPLQTNVHIQGSKSLTHIVLKEKVGNSKETSGDENMITGSAKTSCTQSALQTITNVITMPGANLKVSDSEIPRTTTTSMTVSSSCSETDAVQRKSSSVSTDIMSPPVQGSPTVPAVNVDTEQVFSPVSSTTCVATQGSSSESLAPHSIDSPIVKPPLICSPDVVSSINMSSSITLHEMGSPGISFQGTGSPNVASNIKTSSRSALHETGSPVISSHGTGSPSISSKGSDRSATTEKSAMDIVASFASYVFSAEKSPIKFQTLAQKTQETTPVKNTPPRYRPLAPKPHVGPIVPPPCIFEKKSPRKSPRRRQLQQKAQAICPKGLVIRTTISPSKKAASNIVIRALRRGNRKILPRPLDMSIKTRSLAKQERILQQESRDETETEDDGMDTVSENDTEFMSDGNTEEIMDENNCERGSKRNQQKKCRKKRTKDYHKNVESDDTQSETEDANVYDSQTEEDIDDKDHMARLMAASTTIRFAPKKLSSRDPLFKDNRSKTEKRKDATLAMLAPDLIDIDPQKDDRDTAFAQAYLAKAKEVLESDTQIYEHFLKVLYEFGKSDQSPVKLYKDLATLLSNYPDLIHDFSGFLLPEQAVECGCFMANQEFKRARTFLRKLEVHFERHPAHYQKMMKIFATWNQSSPKDYKKLKDSLEPMLKGHPHLLEEFSLFFEEEKPPDSYMTDFEEITLDDSFDEETLDFDGFEELEALDDEEITGTKNCKCICHDDVQLPNFHKRNRHCHYCCLKVIDGELYYRINSKVMKKVKVVYHEPIKSKDVLSGVKPPPPPIVWEEDDGAEKENQLLIEPEKPKHMGIKLKISQKKKGKQGRFFTLNEMVDSPVKAEDKSNRNKFTCQPSSSQTPKIGLPQFLPDLIPTQDKRWGINCTGASITSSSESNVENIAEADNDRITNKNVQSHKVSPDKHDKSHTSKDIEIKPRDTSVDNNDVSLNQSNTSDSLNLNSIQSPSKENSCADILSKAMKEAMIGQDDVSTMDTLFMGTSGSKSGAVGKAGSNLSAVVSSSQSCKQPLGFTGINSIISNSAKHCEEINDSCSSENLEILKQQNKPDFSDTEKTRSPSALTPKFAKTGGNKQGEKRRITPQPVLDEQTCTSPVFSMSNVKDSHILSKSSPGSKSFIPFAHSANVNSRSSSYSSVETTDISVRKSSAKSCVDGSPDSIRKRGKEITDSVQSPSSIKSAISNLDSNSRDIDPKHIYSPCANSNLSTISSASDTSRTIISSVIGFGNENETFVIKSGSSAKQSSPSSKVFKITKERELTLQSHPSSSEDDKESDSCDSIWSRDDDKVILEKVKKYGPGSATFEKIASLLTGKSATEVSHRFHKLLEMLAEEETPSEEDPEEDRSSSS